MLSTISYFQCAGCLFGLLYIILASKGYQHSWIYGFISAICIVIEDYENTMLYADAFLHILYAVMAFMGILLWKKQENLTEREIRISKMSAINYMGYFAIAILIGGSIGYILDQQTAARFPYLDSFSSTLAVFSTFLVIYRILNVWSYWILINLISIYLYWQTSAPLLSLLYVGYLVSNMIKWKQWRNIFSKQKLKSFTFLKS